MERQHVFKPVSNLLLQSQNLPRIWENDRHWQTRATLLALVKLCQVQQVAHISIPAVSSEPEMEAAAVDALEVKDEAGTRRLPGREPLFCDRWSPVQRVVAGFNLRHCFHVMIPEDDNVHSSICFTWFGRTLGGAAPTRTIQVCMIGLARHARCPWLKSQNKQQTSPL